MNRQGKNSAVQPIRQRARNGDEDLRHEAPQPLSLELRNAVAFRCLFLKSTVRAVLVVVIDVTGKETLQMRFVDVAESLAMPITENVGSASDSDMFCLVWGRLPDPRQPC